MIAERSFAVLARHAGHALSAASMARAVSAAPIIGALPTLSADAGLIDVESGARIGVAPAPIDVALVSQQRRILERQRGAAFGCIGSHGDLLLDSGRRRGTRPPADNYKRPRNGGYRPCIAAACGGGAYPMYSPALPQFPQCASMPARASW